MKPTFTTTITLTQEEKDQLDKIRAAGYTVVGVFRKGMLKIEEEDD